VIWDSNLNFQINLNSDVCQMAPKMCIHYLVGVSHFATYCANRPVTVIINLLNQLWWGKWKSNVDRTKSSPRVKHSGW